MLLIVAVISTLTCVANPSKYKPSRLSRYIRNKDIDSIKKTIELFPNCIRKATNKTYLLKALTGPSGELYFKNILDSVNYSNGNTLSFEYDEFNRITAIITDGIRSYEYTYDNSNQLSEVNDLINSEIVNYEYDLLG